MSMKAFLPWPRRAAIRPATRWRESVSTPAAKPSCSARTAKISSRSENSWGNGSIPASRIRPSLSRRSWRTSESCGSAVGSALIGASLATGLRLLDLGDFEFFLGPARRLDGDDVVPFLTEQGFADRRLVRDVVHARVGPGDPDDLEFLRVAGFLVFHVDDRAEADFVAGDRVLVDDRGPTQPLLELGDPGLEQSLFVLRVVVFGVLGDIAEFTSLLDARRDLTPFGRREELDFLFQLLYPLWGAACLATHP